MPKSSIKPGTIKALLILTALVLLVTLLLSACGETSGTNRGEKSFSYQSDGAANTSGELLPAIFIPGVQGSILVAAKDSRVLWPPGGQSGAVGITEVPSIRDDFFRLSLNPENQHESIFPSDVIRYYGKDTQGKDAVY